MSQANPIEATDDLLDGFLEEFRRYAADRIDALVIDTSKTIPGDVLEELSDMGLFGLALPEAYGGTEFSMRDVCRVVSAIAEWDRSVATTIGLHAGLGSRGLVAFGSPAQKAAWLPQMVTGQWIGAFCATEPAAGSDLMGMKTQAEFCDEGIRINGEKIYVTNGNIATVFTVVTMVEGQGHMLVLVRRDDPGVSTGQEECKMGIQGSSTTSLYLDNVVVPRDRIIGELGKGKEYLSHILCWGRTVLAAGCHGTATTALRQTLQHVSIRKQFNRALCRFDVVQQQVTMMAAMHHAMHCSVMDTTLSQDEPSLAYRSTVAKVFCSNSDWDVCDIAVQLHGGAGFIEETGIPLLLRDARVTRIFEGANDVLLAHLGTMEATQMNTFPEFEPTNPLQERLVGLANQVEDHRQHLSKTFGIRLFGRQRLLHQLGWAAMLREVSRAVVELSTHQQADLAEAWLNEAELRLKTVLTPLPPRELSRKITETLIAGVEL